MAGEFCRVVVADTRTEVVGHLVDDEQDGMVQILAGPERGERELLVAVLPGGFIGEAEKVEVPFPVAIDVIEDFDPSVSLRLPWVCFQLGFGEIAGELGIREGEREVESCLELIVEPVSDVCEEALVVLFAVVAEAILREMGEAEEVVVFSRDTTGGEESADGTETSELRAGGERRGVIARWGDEVDGTAQCGGAELERVRATVDFDGLRNEGFDGLEIEAAVRDVHGYAVLHEFQAAAVEGALNAGTTNGDAGFFGPESWLNEDPR